MAHCIKDAGLKTFLIAKTGTLDLTYYNGLALTLNLTLTLTLTITLTLALTLTLTQTLTQP